MAKTTSDHGLGKCEKLSQQLSMNLKPHTWLSPRPHISHSYSHRISCLLKTSEEALSWSWAYEFHSMHDMNRSVRPDTTKHIIMYCEERCAVCMNSRHTQSYTASLCIRRSATVRHYTQQLITAASETPDLITTVTTANGGFIYYCSCTTLEY